MATTAPRRRTGPLLFVPVGWQRMVFLKWLKRVHAWTGLWGALLFLAMGTSGFLLNHRAVLKIDIGPPREVSTAEISVPGGGPRNVAALDRWTKATFGVPGEGRAPPPSPGAEIRLLGRTMREAPRLERVFALVDGRLTVSTVPGSGVVRVRRDGAGFLAVLKNMHLGSGLGVAWVLLIDTIAGALITMSITGALLWSRLHGPRLVAIAIACTCLAWAVAASAPFFGI